MEREMRLSASLGGLTFSLAWVWPVPCGKRPGSWYIVLVATGQTRMRKNRFCVAVSDRRIDSFPMYTRATGNDVGSNKCLALSAMGRHIRYRIPPRGSQAFVCKSMSPFETREHRSALNAVDRNKRHRPTSRAFRHPCQRLFVRACCPFISVGEQR